MRVVFDEKGKHYILPSGDIVDSVTTVLSKYHKTDLSGWRKSVGNKRADEILTQAQRRGTEIHKLCERYISNKPDYASGSVAVNKFQFMSDIKPILDAHVNTVYGVEFPLYSLSLKTAGTVDLICEWDGVPAIVDYKTSTKIKKEEWIQSYFEQATVYAIMATSQLNIPFHKIIVLMMVDHETPIIYEKSVTDYIKAVKEIFIDSRRG